MRIGKLYALLLLALPIGGTWASLAVTLTGRAELPWMEKRRVTPMPALPHTLAEWEAYPPRFEAFFDDVFGLRSDFIVVNTTFTATLFGRLPSKSVIEGSDGWLYYAFGNALDLYRNALPLTESELAATAEERRRRTDALKARGVTYLMVIAPDKHTIYPEHMPTHLHRLNAPSQLDQLGERMAAAGVPFLDLRAAEREARRAGPVYRRLDTHWNLVGAHAGYVAIVKALAQAGATVPAPIAAPAFGEISATGDLATLARQTTEEPVPSLPGGWKGACAAPVVLAPPVEQVGSQYLRRWSCAGGRGKILVFADSFGEALIPWIATTFAETVFAGSAPLWKDQRELVEKLRPDMVVELRVERQIGDVVGQSIRSAE